MAGSGDLQALAEEFLAACVTALGDTPGGVPEFRCVSPGAPSWDCADGMLTVHIGGPTEADTFPLQPQLAPAHRIARGIEVHMILMTATVLRCDAQIDEEGNLPSNEEITAVARITNADVWGIWNYIKRAKYLNLLWGPKEREVSFLPAISQKQEGGLCGWEIPIAIQLDGYKTSLLPE